MEKEKSLMDPDAIMTAIGKPPISQELTVDQVIAQIDKVKELMQKVMHEGEHYGTIPGTKKPTLYKSGAEKFGTLFRIRPEYHTEIKYLENNHREYQITCNLIHLQIGNIVGQGMGSCSTMESKYRYRHEDQILGPVPKQYWDLRNSDNPEAAKGLLEVGTRVKKIDNEWVIVQSGERIENPDIADCYNTCWNMGAKRSHVAAMLTACAASDIFTQDPEDFQGRQEVKAEVIDATPEADMAAPLIPKEEKKRGRLSKEEILKRSESVTKLMLENGTIEQKEFEQIAKHTAEIADDYQQLYDSYKALCEKYKSGLPIEEPKETKDSISDDTHATGIVSDIVDPPEFSQDLPGGIF